MPTRLMTDERLARSVGQGNDRAFNTLYSRYHQQLYRYCHSIVRHEADAQDALQSTFTAALTALRRSQRDAPLRPWLYRIAHNESISLLRRRRVTDELPETLPGGARSAEATAEERARFALLVSDLQALPERQRGALVMRELSGLSHEELAQALEISVGAAKQSVFEARQALAEFAEGRAMACEEIQKLVSDGDKRVLRGRRVRAHLRDCQPCHAFADAIPERRGALLALSPALPAAAAAGLLQRITGVAHHGGGGGLLAGAGGKSIGVALSAKTVATGIAIVATAAVGAVGTVEVVSHSGHSHGQTRLLNDGHQGSAAGGSTAAGGQASGAHGARASGIGSLVAGTHRQARAHAIQGLGGTHGSGSSVSSAGSKSNGGGSSNAHGANPNANGGNPNSAGGNPKSNGAGSTNSHGTNPNAKGGNSHAGGGSGGSSGAKTGAHGTNPNAGGGTSTTSHGSNPNSGAGNPNSGGGTSTTSHGSNPNSAGGNPNSTGGNPNSAGGNPNSGSGTSTTSHGSNPNGGSGK